MWYIVIGSCILVVSVHGFFISRIKILVRRGAFVLLVSPAFVRFPRMRYVMQKYQLPRQPYFFLSFAFWSTFGFISPFATRHGLHNKCICGVFLLSCESFISLFSLLVLSRTSIFNFFYLFYVRPLFASLTFLIFEWPLLEITHTPEKRWSSKPVFFNLLIKSNNTPFC